MSYRGENCGQSRSARCKPVPNSGNTASRKITKGAQIMLKGAQKRMYVVKLGEDSLFEEAYFVLRREAGSVQGGDMVSEANRIIRQSDRGPTQPPRKSRGLWKIALGFACGLVTGGGIATAICLLL